MPDDLETRIVHALGFDTLGWYECARALDGLHTVLEEALEDAREEGYAKGHTVGATEGIAFQREADIKTASLYGTIGLAVAADIRGD